MDFEKIRERMVNEQLIPRGISDPRVLEVFKNVERHKFVAGSLREMAYADHPLPLDEKQTISQPYMTALMTEKLALTGSERVLEVGTGSGYQAAILAELAKEVYTVERFDGLAQSAKKTLEALGYRNIHVKVGDGTLGWPEHAPFDRIVVTAGAPRIPQSLIDQLGKNGRMVIPVGGDFSQILTLVEKGDHNIMASEICGCVFVPLVGKEGWKTEDRQ